MEAILKFNLPEDQSEFNNAVKASDYHFALHEMREYLRRELKYNGALTEVEYQTIEKVREEFNGILTSNDINL